jgi:hypothetical protein
VLEFFPRMILTFPSLFFLSLDNHLNQHCRYHPPARLKRPQLMHIARNSRIALAGALARGQG